MYILCCYNTFTYQTIYILPIYNECNYYPYVCKCLFAFKYFNHYK